MAKSTYSEEAKVELLEKLLSIADDGVITSKALSDFVKTNSLAFPYFLTLDKGRSMGWGKYYVGALPKPAIKATDKVDAAVKEALAVDATMVPLKDPTYQPFGFYNDLREIISSKIFYPVYITGLSGNGKTLMVNQICADLGRELIRVNITKDTDDFELIGSHELINGSTIYREGPVITAMKRGAILLLDETDYGSERLLCLQPILEGKPFLNKKTGEVVVPQPGFNVMATANTKGKGSNDGRFVGANVLNEAFLERFAITIEQEYPNLATETKIMEKNFKVLGLDLTENANFIKCLVRWAELVRKSYNESSVDEIISTRRLTHIARAFSVFKNKKKAITLCLNRFDDETKIAILDLYTKIDAEVDKEEKAAKAAAERKAKGETVASEPTQSTITSSLEFVPIAATLSKRYGSKVDIASSKDPATGKDVITVGSHGRQNKEFLNALGALGSSEFVDKLARMVEVNKVAAATAKP